MKFILPKPEMPGARPHPETDRRAPTVCMTRAEAHEAHARLIGYIVIVGLIALLAVVLSIAALIAL